jgi:phenylalanyl-tRNA synthetase beta subunit
MKIIYSKIKEFLPDLNFPAEKTADDLTLIGHLCEGVEEINGKKLINLEIPKDRGDCLSYYGLAKDLSVLYNIKLETPKVKLTQRKSKKKPNITVSAKKEVYRLMSLKIKNIINKPSPVWLKKFLNLHQINSINTLVDLTNYVMLIYGIPCHAFDAQKVSNRLEWKITSRRDKITTLDGTKINIPSGTLVIADPNGSASLSTIGGRRTAIDLKTTETIVEMAIYNPQRVRLDSKNMNVITEASIRLEKKLDTELIPIAFNHLISLILENCGGQISTKTFDYYPKKLLPSTINYHPQKPSDYAGIEIPEKFGLETLKKLDCKVTKENNHYRVIPSTLRKDLNLEEDLIEEVIRFYGYDKIPINKPISSEKLPDITPKILYLIETVKNILINLGYDEIRSWPIIRPKRLHQPNYLPENTEPIYTENNVNSEFPLLRMSIGSSLHRQTIQYKKLKIPDQKFFEVGKIYYQNKNKYLENYSVGFYQPNFETLKSDAEKLLKKLKVGDYQHSVEKINNKKFIEINLTELLNHIQKVPQISLNHPEIQKAEAVELNRQIIDLDANVILDSKIEPEKLIKKYQNKIDSKIMWKLEIIDIYQTKNKQYKYTFRAYYYNTTAAHAKKIHLEAFNLI